MGDASGLTGGRLPRHSGRMSPQTCRLYLISPPTIVSIAAFAKLFDMACTGGDVAALQIRLKDASEAEIEDLVWALKPIASARGAVLILNDRPEWAARFGCDGVHIGQEDGSYAEARAAVGRDGIVGVTCHDSRHLAMEAAEAGADYVAFGAFFDTSTKAPKTRAEPELLEAWQESMTTPCVAIGGITVARARGLAKAGADFLAVSAGVWNYRGGPPAAVTAFNAEMAAGVAERAVL